MPSTNKRMQALHAVVVQLFEIQRDKALTDEQLSDKAGYPHNTMIRWRGLRNNPMLQTLSDYAEAMGYEIRLVPKAPLTGEPKQRK